MAKKARVTGLLLASLRLTSPLLCAVPFVPILNCWRERERERERAKVEGRRAEQEDKFSVLRTEYQDQVGHGPGLYWSSQTDGERMYALVLRSNRLSAKTK
jgi:hypothetical protein